MELFIKNPSSEALNNCFSVTKQNRYLYFELFILCLYRLHCAVKLQFGLFDIEFGPHTFKAEVDSHVYLQIISLCLP